MKSIKHIMLCSLALAASLTANANNEMNVNETCSVQNTLNANAQWTGDATGFWKVRIGANVKDLPRTQPGLYTSVEKQELDNDEYMYNYLKGDENPFTIITNKAGIIKYITIHMDSDIALSLMGTTVTANTLYHTLMKNQANKIKWGLKDGGLVLYLGSQNVYCSPFGFAFTDRGRKKVIRIQETEKLVPIYLSDIQSDVILQDIYIE